MSTLVPSPLIVGLRLTADASLDTNATRDAEVGVLHRQDTTAGAHTVTLPVTASDDPGRALAIVNEAGSNNVTVAVQSGDTLDNVVDGTDTILPGESAVYFVGESGKWVTAADKRTGTVNTDESAKVSANDTTAGFLNGKLTAGANVTLTEQSDGGNETLEISATDTNTDESAKVSANDTTPGFLNGKLVAGTNITLTENNDGANETLTIDAAGGGGDTVKVSANDTTSDYLGTKLVAGSNITLTENNDGANETLTIDASGGGGGGQNGNGTVSSLRVGLTANQVDIGVGSAIAFDDEIQALGSAVSLNTSNGQITVQPGTFVLWATVALDHTTGFARRYAWYDVTNAQEVPGNRHHNRSVNGSADNTGQHISRAVVSVSVPTVYELRFVDGAVGPDIDSAYTFAEVTQIITSTEAGVGGYGSFVRGYLSTNQADIAIGGAVAFDTVQDSAGTAISLNTSNGQVTVAANRRYELWGSVQTEHTAAFEHQYAWYDVTTGAEVGTRIRNRSTTASADWGTQHAVKVTVEPSQQTVYEFRRVGGGTDNVDLTQDFTMFEVVEQTKEGAAYGVTSNLWSGATRNSSADDNEFELASELSAYTAQQGGFATAEVAATFSQDTVDAYDSTFTSGTDVRTAVNPSTRPSWWLIQPPADGNAYVLSKPVTLATNALVIVRLKANLRNASQTNDDATIGLMFGYDNGSGLVDTNGSAHGFIAAQETDAGTVEANLLYSNDGTSTTIDAASSNINQSGNSFNMVAMHKVGTTYYFWAGTDTGNWLYLDSFVQATPFDRIGLYVSNATATSPGPQVLGVDYIRFIETDNFLL